MPPMNETANMPPPTNNPTKTSAESPIRSGLTQFTGGVFFPFPFFFLEPAPREVAAEAFAATSTSSSSSSETGIAASLSLAFKNANSSSSAAAGGLTTKGFLHLGHGTRLPTAPRFLSFRLALQLGQNTVIASLIGAAPGIIKRKSDIWSVAVCGRNITGIMVLAARGGHLPFGGSGRPAGDRSRHRVGEIGEGIGRPGDP